MHITILAYGSRGDVQPYVALGVGLEQAGHTVRLAAPDMFRSFVSGYGLEFMPLAGDPRLLMQNLVDHAGGQTNLLRSLPVLFKYASSVALDMFADARRACEGTGAIIHSMLTTSMGHEIALDLGVPDITAPVFVIFSPTSAFPSPVFPAWPLGDWYNRLTHHFFNQLFWHGGRAAYNWIRRHQRDLYPPLTEWPFGPSSKQIPPILYGFSPSVIPKPPDWNEDTHVTGYWFLPPQEPDAPELEQFLEDGPPPVCISFGSIIDREAKQLTEIAIEALARSGQRGVLITGWGGLAELDLPETVLAAQFVPFEWLFPRSAAVVIHGGIGTTAAAMQAGIPSVVVPFVADQSFWGDKVHELGVGPKPIPRKKLTVSRLAGAIQKAVTDSAMRQRAGQLGQALRAENGVQNAVHILERYLA